MKKIKILFTIMAVVLFTASCETYDDYNTDRPTIVGFTTASKNLKVPSNGTKDLVLDVYVSDPSNVDRTFTVSVVTDETEAAAENYTFDPTFVILANEQTAEFTITGVDVSLSDERLPLTLQIDATGQTISGGRSVITLYK